MTSLYYQTLRLVLLPLRNNPEVRGLKNVIMNEMEEELYYVV